MWNAIANAVRGGISSGASVTPPEPVTVYKLGIEGELEGGTLFHYYNEYWYDSHPTYAFYELDLASIDFVTLANFTIDDVEELFSGDTILGRSDWQLVQEPNPNSLGFVGYPTHEYSSSQGIMDSFMSATFLNKIANDCAFEVFSGTASQYSKIRVLYKEYSGIGCLEAPFPQTPNDLPSVNNASNWVKVSLPNTLLGVTLATENVLSEGALKTRYYAARCVNYLGTIEPPTISIPPSPLNVYDSNAIIPNAITPNVILSYGDVLDADRLSTTIDRYRETPQIQSTVNPVKGVSSELSVEGYSDSSINQIVSVDSYNKQIIVKLYVLQQNKPPNPWYDKDADEVITASAKMVCYKNSSAGTNALLTQLSLLSYLDNITAEAETFTTDTIVLNGVSYYTAIHTFKFDVSNVKIILTDTERTTLGITDDFGVVTDLEYIGSLDDNVSLKMRSMLFEILELRFATNKLSQTRDLSGIIKTGRRVIVPTIGGSIGVGQDASLYILSPEEPGVEAPGALYLSMKAGEVAPDINKKDFSFEFDSNMSQDVSAVVSPALNFASVFFDTVSGAMTKDSVFKCVLGDFFTIQFSGTFEVSVDTAEPTLSNSPNLSLDLIMVLNKNEIVNIATSTVSTVGTIDTYTFTVDYTHTFTGSSNFSILESASFNVRTMNKTGGDIATLTIKAGSRVFSTLIDYDPNAPTSNPAYFQTPPPPVERFNQY
jgi:hypothetical protein